MNTTIDADLIHLFKRLKLGPLLPTLPERLALARAQQLDYTAFLTLLLARRGPAPRPASPRTPSTISDCVA